MARYLALAALAALLACAAAHPVTDACAGHQDQYFGVTNNEFIDSAKTNYVEQAFNTFEPWLIRDLAKRGIIAEGCTFTADIKQDACYSVVGRDASGKATQGEYGFGFELDFE